MHLIKVIEQVIFVPKVTFGVTLGSYKAFLTKNQTIGVQGNIKPLYRRIQTTQLHIDT